MGINPDAALILRLRRHWLLLSNCLGHPALPSIYRFDQLSRECNLMAFRETEAVSPQKGCRQVHL